jgi:hypothetical protein
VFGVWRAAVFGVAALAAAPLGAEDSTSSDSGAPPSPATWSLISETAPELAENGAPFYRPRAIAADRSGGAWVLDSGLPALFHFDPVGSFLCQVDAVGEGPGELRQPTRIAGTPGGGVVVYDTVNRRLSWFDREGVLVESRGFQPMVWNLAVGAEGALFVETRRMDLDGNRGGTRIRILRYAADLSAAALIDSALIATDTYIREPVFTNVPIPFHPELLWRLLPEERLLTARSADFVLRIFDAESLQLERTIQLAGAREPVTEADRQRHFESMSSSVDGVISHGAPEHIRRATRFPSHKPHFRQLWIDEMGNALLETYARRDGRYVVCALDLRDETRDSFTWPELDWTTAFSDSSMFRIEFKETGPQLQVYRKKP